MLCMHDFSPHKVVIKLNRILHNGHIKNRNKYQAQITPIKNKQNISIEDILIIKELQNHPRKVVEGKY